MTKTIVFKLRAPYMGYLDEVVAARMCIEKLEKLGWPPPETVTVIKIGYRRDDFINDKYTAVCRATFNKTDTLIWKALNNNI
jgi:hypothetical protein